MKLPIRHLGEFVEEQTERLREKSATIYSVTNESGFVPSLDLFDKQVFSANTGNYKRVQFHDLAYNPSRINVGSVALCEDENGGAVSPMYVIVRCKQNFNPRYLLHFLKSEAGQHQIRHRCEGAIRFQLRFHDLCTIPILAPPLSEQGRIVSLLDEADMLRRLRNQTDRRTADLIPAIFCQMFGDPSGNPKRWPIIPAGDLMMLCEYGCSQKANENTEGIPMLRMGNVTNAGLLDLTDLKHVALDEKDLKKYRLATGDVLFNRTNSRELVGKTGMWDGRFEAIAASYFIRVRFNAEKEDPQHFTTFMNLPYMKQRLMEMARGAIGQSNINAQELQAIPIPVPPLPLQREFAERVKEIREMESAQAQSRARLDALFASLLDKAFKGELS